MLSNTSAAVQQARRRNRRARGFRCLLVEIGDEDIAGLVALGQLDLMHRDDVEQVQAALSRFLDQALAGYITRTARNA